MHRASCCILGKRNRMLTHIDILYQNWFLYALTQAFRGWPFLNLKALNINILKDIAFFFCVCFTTAPGEERWHSRILEASLWKFEGREGLRPIRMYWFTTAETGEQHLQLPAHSHTPSAECKKQSQWQTECKQAHRLSVIIFFWSKELCMSMLKITTDLAAKEKTYASIKISVFTLDLIIDVFWCANCWIRANWARSVSITYLQINHSKQSQVKFISVLMNIHTKQVKTCWWAFLSLFACESLSRHYQFPLVYSYPGFS